MTGSLSSVERLTSSWWASTSAWLETELVTPEHPAGGSAGRPSSPQADVDVAASAGASAGTGTTAGGSAAAGGTGTTAGGGVVGGELLQPLGAHEIQETFQAVSSYGMRVWSYTNDGVSVVRRFFSTSLGPSISSISSISSTFSTSLGPPTPSKGKGSKGKKQKKTKKTTKTSTPTGTKARKATARGSAGAARKGPRKATAGESAKATPKATLVESIADESSAAVLARSARLTRLTCSQSSAAVLALRLQLRAEQLLAFQMARDHALLYALRSTAAVAATDAAMQGQPPGYAHFESIHRLTVLPVDGGPPVVTEESTSVTMGGVEGRVGVGIGVGDEEASPVRARARARPYLDARSRWASMHVLTTALRLPTGACARPVWQQPRARRPWSASRVCQLFDQRAFAAAGRGRRVLAGRLARPRVVASG